MNQILNKVRDVDPNNGDAVKEALAAFFQNLQKHTELDCYRWLRALEGVVCRFPKYCMSHRPTIEKYLIHFLDSNNFFNVIEAAKCAHALQQVRPSQEKTATAKSCWREQMSLLCGAAHLLIGALFPQAVDIYKQTGKSQKEHQAVDSLLSTALSHISAVSKTQSSSVDKHAHIATRLRNVFVFIQAMLVEIYPVAKPVRPQAILDVVRRALSVSSGTAGPGSCHVVMVKTEALGTLDALVACLGSNLIPFSPLVLRFVTQTLKWSSDSTIAESNKVRCAAYSSLGRWLTVLRTHRAPPAGRGRCWQDELAEHVVADITPHRHIVQLTMSNQHTKHLSKKAKRKMANTMLQDSNIASHMPGEKNKIPVSEETSDEVPIAALECAETFLTVCGMFLKPSTLKLFHERLVRECYNLRAFGCPRALRLLRALEATRKAAPPGPTHHCLQLYSVMVASPHREISNFCSQALLDIRLHLHCSPPSLNFAIEVQPEKQKQTEEKKIVSEKNRAALKALLGPDKIPTQNTEEIITIADEPAKKRQRFEEDLSDKISVSSESERSIEISDDSMDEASVVQEVEAVVEPVKEAVENGVLIEERNEVQLDEVDGNDIGERKETAVIEIEIEQDDDNDVLQIDESSRTEIAEIKNSDIALDQKSDTSAQERLNIFNATTQMPVNTSTDTVDEEERLSMEVTYDYPNTGTEKVTALETLDVENVPSSNDTDDIQITCGQVVKYSQDEKKSEDFGAKLVEDGPKVNGVKSPTKAFLKEIPDIDNESSVATKGAPNESVSVEDMLADFVDEVIEDTTQEKTTA